MRTIDDVAIGLPGWELTLLSVTVIAAGTVIGVTAIGICTARMRSCRAWLDDQERTRQRYRG